MMEQKRELHIGKRLKVLDYSKNRLIINNYRCIDSPYNVYLLFRSTKLKEYASLPASERKEKIAAEWEKVNSDPAQLKEWKRLNEEKYADRNC